ncbi:MAG TPA: sugar transferase [Vicinamibacteria bacterium]|nr:sugar transferase [Vicinamibacteria bacterium]
MRVFPVLIDTKPPYLEGGADPTSLLLAPVGSSTLVGQFGASFSEVSRNPLIVLTAFEPSPGYEEALRSAYKSIDYVLPAQDFRARLSSFEPSDWLLLADARRVPARGLDFAGLLREIGNDPRRVRHQVALENSVGGTKECIQAGPEGRVMRLQRYYESVTWPFAEGVPCSFVPVASTVVARDLPFFSLDRLRAALSALGVPSGDLTVAGGAFDLFDPRALLALNERTIMQLPCFREGAPHPHKPLLGRRCEVDPSARLIGPVVLHDDVKVGAGVTIVGPALLGAGSVVEEGAVVAQSLVFPEAVVKANTTVRQRVVANRSPEVEVRPRTSSRMQVTEPFVGPPAGYHEPLADVSEHKRHSVYPSVKFVVEAFIAFVALVALSPLLLLLAILVKLDSRGPVFYGDGREGRGGLMFRCWKFRTMRPDAHARQHELLAKNQVDGPQFKLENDPRVTRLGRFLRPTNLDERPQLVNVFLGQMSFVGPRPSPFRENQMCIPWRDARLSVRPGITGLWQVCRHERASGDFHQWIYYDLLYVRLMSPWLDLKILTATVLTLGGRTSVPLSSLLDPNSFEERRRPPRGSGSLLGRSSLQH